MKAQNRFCFMVLTVSLDSFIRKITFQEITRDGIAALGPAIQVMAANEHLDAHKNAVTVRLNEKL